MWGKLGKSGRSTSLRSSTLYTWASPSSSFTSDPMSRGTAMSKKRRRPPTAALAAGRPSRDFLVISNSAALLAAGDAHRHTSQRHPMRRQCTGHGPLDVVRA